MVLRHHRSPGFSPDIAQLKNMSIKVFELAPPGTDTVLFHGDLSPEDVGGVKSMSVETPRSMQLLSSKKIS
jgi:hypothetical protein